MQLALFTQEETLRTGAKIIKTLLCYEILITFVALFNRTQHL